MVNDDGLDALHISAREGYLAVTKLLVKAGADLEARTADRHKLTALHHAARGGHLEVVSMLVEAGANPNSRADLGTTPLYLMATAGDLDGVRVLLRAGADPMLATTNPRTGDGFVPLDTAARNGHSEIVSELIQRFGIGGCGGAGGGTTALEIAASEPHLEIMEMLTSAGVADVGYALLSAAKNGHDGNVKLLLQQEEVGSRLGYVDVQDWSGRTPMVYAVECAKFASSRVVRLLVDAGADATSAVQATDLESEAVFTGTPLAFATRALRQKKVRGEEATEDELNSLEATRRLLLRLEAVHATSWLWPSAVPSVVRSAPKGSSRTKTSTTPLALGLPVLRRRARRRGVLLRPLLR